MTGTVSPVSKATRETVRTATESSATPTTPVTASAPSLTIEARIDVGFGNTLFIRGEGNGLNWERGVPLTCVDGETWQWSGPATEKLTFKLLLNDSVWAQGDDIVARPGQRLEIRPRF